MDIGDGFPKFVANQSVGAKVWILHYAAADRQSDQNLAGKLFLLDAWLKCKTVSNPKSLKKHDIVNDFGPSKMVLELINIRKSFPNTLIVTKNGY